MRKKRLTQAQTAALLDLACSNTMQEHKTGTYQALEKLGLVAQAASKAGGWFITDVGLAQLVHLGMGTLTPTLPPTFIRKAYLHLCKDGTVSVRLAGKPIFNGVAFSVLECASEEEARSVQILTCKLQHHPHPDMAAGEPWYKLGSGPFPLGFSGNYEDISTAEEYLTECLKLVRGRRRASVGNPR